MDSEREGCTRAMRMPSSTTRPWENVEFAAPPPPGGKDRLIADQVLDGWLIRCHREPRKRYFHPVHKAAPLAADNLEVDRVTIGFVTEPKEKFIYQDRWTDPVRDHGRGQWTGWTFFKVKKRDGLSAGSDLGAPHDRGALQPGGPELPGAEGAHRVLLSEMQGSETLGSIGVPSAVVAKSYAPLPTSRAPRAKSRWQTSAVERAQPILSDLRRRDGGLSPEEEELSEHSWNEIIEDV